jgi:hypothetical protein
VGVWVSIAGVVVLGGGGGDDGKEDDDLEHFDGGCGVGL